jgi:AcrR family transcriptional regulator
MVIMQSWPVASSHTSAGVPLGCVAGTGRRAKPSGLPDARRNEETLLDAAAAIFVKSGVEAPIRDIATKAGVGTATIYRHFPTRAHLIVAVYRHQVEACAGLRRPH